MKLYDIYDFNEILFETEMTSVEFLVGYSHTHSSRRKCSEVFRFFKYFASYIRFYPRQKDRKV